MIGEALKKAMRPASSVRNADSGRPRSRRTPNANSSTVSAVASAASGKLRRFMTRRQRERIAGLPRDGRRRSHLQHGGAVDAFGFEVGEGLVGLARTGTGWSSP